MNRELIERTIRDWIPRRDRSFDNYFGRGSNRKKVVFQSPNYRIWLSLGGDIYTFHLSIGKLAICYESDELGGGEK